MNDMEQRQFGKHDFKVSVLGFGAGHIGGADQSEKEVDTLLNTIVDLGINLIDTARGYGLSEERIGKFLSHRRHDVIISTKVGYSIEGHQDWTYDCVTEGIERALRLLRTDYIDIVHLHSCSLDVLQQQHAIHALNNAAKAGKIRVAAYSGENQELDFAVNHSLVESLQFSINLFDQKSIDNQLKIAQQRNLGVIAKRPVGNAPWRFDTQPFGNYAEEYWLRWKLMNMNNFGIDWQEFALRFTAFLDGVHTCIVGTSNIEHFKQNMAIVEKGKLPDEMAQHIMQIFREKGENWYGQV